MEGNPVHWDEEAAAASRYGEVVATPLYPMHSTTRRAPGTADPLDRVHDDPGWDGTDLAAGLGGLPPIDVPLKRILNGGTEAEFFRLAKLGDVVSAQSRYTDISEREGRSGPMVLLKVETTYTDGDIGFRQHTAGHTPGPNWPTFLTFAERYFAPGMKRR